MPKYRNKKKDIQERLGVYKEALAAHFHVDDNALSPEMLQTVIEGVANGEVLIVCTSNHAMLVYKELNRLYFYDPNDGEVGFGGHWNEADVVKIITQKCYLPAPGNFVGPDGVVLSEFNLQKLTTDYVDPPEFVMGLDAEESPFVTGKGEEFLRGASFDELFPLVLKDLYYNVCLLQKKGTAAGDLMASIESNSSEEIKKHLSEFCINVAENPNVSMDKRALLEKIKLVLNDPEKAVIYIRAEGGVLGPVSQGEREEEPVILKLMAAYLNTVYNPGIQVDAKGVCYGLCVILRELIVQTGSVQKAHSMFYSQLHLLKAYATQIDVDLDVSSKLSADEVKNLGQLELITSMIWLFQLQQGFVFSNHDRIPDIREALAVRKDNVCILPLSLPMTHSVSRVGGGSSKPVVKVLSNPIEVYAILKEVGFAGENALINDSTEIHTLDDEFIQVAFDKNPLVLSFASDSMKTIIGSDRERMIAAVSSRGGILKFATVALRGDKDLALAAVKCDGRAFQFVSEELKLDRDIVLRAVKSYGSALGLAAESFRDDDKIALAAVMSRKDGTFQYASDRLKEDKKFVKSVVKHKPYALQQASRALRGNEEVVLTAVRVDGNVLEYASDELRGNPNVVMAAVQSRGSALTYATEALQNNDDFIFQVVPLSSRALKYAPERFKGNKQLILEACRKRNYWGLRYVSDILRDDKDFFLEVLGSSADVRGVLQYASQRLREDKDLVMAAVAKDGIALRYASSGLRNDPELVLQAVENSRWSLQYASDGLRKEKEFILPLIKKWGSILEYVSPVLQGDLEIVREAVKQDSCSLRYASESIRSDRDFMLPLLNQGLKLFEYASSELRNDPEIALLAVQKMGGNLQYASADLQASRDIVLAAAMKDHWSLQYASSHLKKDKDFVLLLLENCGGEVFEYASKDLKGNPDVALRAVEKDPDNLRYASDEIQANGDIVLAAAVSDHGALTYASLKLRGDKKFILALFEKCGPRVMDYASADLKIDKDILLLVLQKDVSYLRYIARELQLDVSFIVDVLKKQPAAYGYIDHSLRFLPEVVLACNKEVILSVLQQSPASGLDNLKENKDFALKAIGINEKVIAHLSDTLKNDPDVVKEAVIRDGALLRYASIELQNNLEIVLIALYFNPNLASSINENLQKDPVFNACFKKLPGLRVEGDLATADVLERIKEIIIDCQRFTPVLPTDEERPAVSQGGGVVGLISQLNPMGFFRNLAGSHAISRIDQAAQMLDVSRMTLQHADRKTVLIRVRQDGASFQYVSDKLKKDKEVAFTAIYSNPVALEYVDEGLKDDAFMECAIALIEYKKSARPDDQGLKKIAEAVETLGK